MSDEKRPKSHRFEDRFYGSATVGERGQIVIPADARKRFQIETGDKLLIMGTPDEKGIVLCKIDDIREFMTMFLEGLQNIEKESNPSIAEEKAP